MKPHILIAQGDYNGIGPEVALQAALSKEVQRICQPVLVGSLQVFEYYAKILHKKILLKEILDPDETKSSSRSTITVLQVGQFERFTITPGSVSADAGRFAGNIITLCATLCLNESAHAMVTAPVSKEALYRGGYRYRGQTDLLAALCRTQQYAMLLIVDRLRVGLTTIHLPLKLVHRSIKQKTILQKLSVLHNTLKRDFAIKSPRIAVLGLNPHAGENGLLGTEEKSELLPALRKARARKIRAQGPFPADGFFGARAHKTYDAVLAMYHDQGLIPLKMMGFEHGVNFTAGLPIVRTSPDHGTAFDIAGKGIADPHSMIEAVKLAAFIAKNRMKG